MVNKFVTPSVIRFTVFFSFFIVLFLEEKFKL